MIPEEKQLLLVDLCTRQPYKVKISIDNDNLFIPRLKYIDGLICHFYECAWTRYLDEIKPYLRSMYTMTDEEAKEYLGMLNDIDKSGLMNHNFITKVVDWLDKKMFDHRGLIPKKLALEATKGMYKTE